MRRVCLLFAGMLILVMAAGLPAAGFAASYSLTTQFDGHDGYGGNMFDVTVLSATDDLSIDSFDISITGDPIGVNVYYREGGYSGYETNESAWTLAGSATVTPQGIGNPTPLAVGGITLEAGKTYGLYVDIDSSSMANSVWFTNGSTAHQDTYIQISAGAALTWGKFTGAQSPRIWNGTIYYTVVPPAEPAAQPPQTGDSTGPYLWLYIAAAVVAFGAGLVLVKKHAGVRSKS